MGKSDKRKRRSSPSSSSHSYDGKTKSSNTVEGRKEKRKRSSEHKESSSLHSHKEFCAKKKLSDKRKDKHRKKDRHQKLKIQELTEDDYFSKNNEFATWLNEERKIYFSDLSSCSARELFSEFMNEWNKHKLGPQYYAGILKAPRSAHNWKIK